MRGAPSPGRLVASWLGVAEGTNSAALYSGEMELLTVREAAALAGVSESTWRAYVARGQAPRPDVRLGATPGWQRSTIESWIAARPRAAGRATGPS